jgi:hypothetical protein
MTKEEYKKQWYLKNKERILKKLKERYELNKEEIKERSRKWREDNREKHRAYSREWNEKNPERARKRLEDWYKSNPEMRAFYSARRKASLRKATPNWLSDEEITRIRCIYQICAMYNRESNTQWHVDHIVPLAGKTVCGLHVPWNLRVIPAKENMSKGNKYNG